MKKLILIIVGIIVVVGIVPYLLSCIFCGAPIDETTTVPWKDDLPTSFAKGRMKILPRETGGSKSWHIVFPQFRDVYFGGEYHRNILGPFKIVKKKATNSSFFGKNYYFLTLEILDTAGEAGDTEKRGKNNYEVMLKFSSKLERDRINTWLEQKGKSGRLDITELFRDESCSSLVNFPKLEKKDKTLINCSL